MIRSSKGKVAHTDHASLMLEQMEAEARRLRIDRSNAGRDHREADWEEAEEEEEEEEAKRSVHSHTIDVKAAGASDATDEEGDLEEAQHDAARGMAKEKRSQYMRHPSRRYTDGSLQQKPSMKRRTSTTDAFSIDQVLDIGLHELRAARQVAEHAAGLVPHSKLQTTLCSRCTAMYKELNGRWNESWLVSVMTRVVSSPWFDHFILVLILVSTAAIAVDNPLADPNTPFVKALAAIDTAVSILFVIEMILKMVAWGLPKYFGDGWNLLDFCLVIISLLGMVGGSNGGMASLRSLRAMRSLRPLKLIRSNPGMKAVISALLNSLPPCFKVVCTSILVLTIMALVGVR
jgi:hypothetical protein